MRHTLKPREEEERAVTDAPVPADDTHALRYLVVVAGDHLVQRRERRRP
ncbi:hypothetical protein [Streptomyces sp. NPDC060031]